MEQNSKPSKLTYVYGVSGFNILLTLSTIAYLVYSVYTLNARVMILEEKVTQTGHFKMAKRFERSLDQDYFMKPCGVCKQICNDILGRREMKVGHKIFRCRELGPTFRLP
mgnify:CR=1 FL=1